MKYTRENCIGMIINSYGSTYEILRIKKNTCYLKDMQNPSRDPFIARLNIQAILRNMNNGTYQFTLPETYEIF